MKIFLSVAASYPTDCDAIKEVEPLENVNILCSFQYKKGIGTHNINEFKDFIADSGAFTAMSTGKK